MTKNHITDDAQPTVGSIYDAVYRANGSTLNDGEAVRKAIACALSQPSPAATVDAVTDEDLAISGLNKDWNAAMRRALDAEADALRLHGEKMEMYERAIAAEAKLAAHNGSSAGSDAANALAKRLHHAAVTMQNDDISEPQSEKRRRHIERYETLIDAVDYLSAQPQSLSNPPVAS
jgi:hypothetical protein